MKTKWLCVMAAIAIAAPGCRDVEWKWPDWGKRRNKSRTPKAETTKDIVDANTTTVDWELRAANQLKVLEGTIGELADPSWIRSIPVSGYGLVAQLGEDGSRECPPRIREQLAKEIRRAPHMFKPDNWGPKKFTADAFLNLLDTAVVHITGSIPPGAPLGEVFDLQIEALEGTKTRSLEGGMLLPADLAARGSAFAGRLTRTQTLAVAHGPVFVNPFGRQADKQGATPAYLRRGKVAGGGRNRRTRNVTLMLKDPSYPRMARVAAVINAQFPGDLPIAEARDPQQLVLGIPPKYKHRYKRFLALVTHLYIDDTPGYRTQKAQELAELILQREAPYSHIALCWEGIGKPIIPIIRKLYNHENEPAAIWATVTGLRLQDRLTDQVLSRILRDPKSRYRKLVIDELGWAPARVWSADVLKPLLGDPDTRIRVAAYHALRKMHDVSIRTIRAGDFELDLVDTEGTPLVLATTSRSQRIALFGGLRVRPPLLYKHSDGIFLLSAHPGDKEISVYRKTRVSRGGKGGRATLPLDVAAMIEMMAADTRIVNGKIVGLELSYGHVVGAVQALCESRAIRAPFELERPTVSDFYGPMDLPEEVPEEVPEETAADAEARASTGNVGDS